MKLKLLKTLCLLFTSFTLLSQSFIEQQLPTPQNLSSLFIGPLIHSTIHYGAKPPNSNGKVILFNHGYIDLNQLFFTNNTFYQEAYNAGYQVAFVATTRGEGLWVNGKLLAEAIDIVCEKYAVQNLTIVAHSNGGKASEVAMYVHHKYDKVKRVFALGTPYWGTYLADISQQWWFNWLWKYTGLNEGSATSTTYYCKEVVRPYFDTHVNNEPEKFVIVGGSGFANGHTLLAPLMFTSGAILYTHQGTNDGVAPYNSTLRPGAYSIFSKGEAKLDHIDVALGQYVWKYIKPLLDANIAKTTSNKYSTGNPSLQQVKSNYQIINSENKYETINLDKGNSKGILTVYHPKNAALFELKSTKATLSRIKKETPSNISLHTHISEYHLTSESQSINLNSNDNFVAFLKQPNGIEMIFESFKETNLLKVHFSDTEIKPTQTQVNAIITKTADIYGNPVSNDNIFVHSFTAERNSTVFVLDTSEFDKGIYSIQITGKHPHFTRSLISGFIKGSLTHKNILQQELKNSNPLNITLKNPVVSNSIEFTLNSSTISIKKPEFSVYTINGQCLLKKSFDTQNTTYMVDISNLPSGYYIITASLNEITKSFKVIKK